MLTKDSPEKVNGKYDLLFNDYVINPEICNFKCKYCLSNEAPEEYISFYKEKKRSIQKEDQICLEKYEELLNAKILRLSGGEILLNRNLIHWIDQIHNRYETIQILTNGYYITEEFLDSIKYWNNVFLHISIDGHTYELNQYRVENQNIHRKLINNLLLCRKYGISFEIGSVLTNVNTAEYYSFLEFLLQGFDVLVYPFPVRGDRKGVFSATRNQIAKFKEKILDRYTKYERILPSRIYIEKLISALNGENLYDRCYIPYFGVQTFNSGMCTPCMNFWERSFGNIFENKDSIDAKLESDKIYKVLGRKHLCIKYCQECYTSLDIFNLYLNSQIEESELDKFKMLGSRSKNYLRNLRRKINNEQ